LLRNISPNQYRKSTRKKNTEGNVALDSPAPMNTAVLLYQACFGICPNPDKKTSHATGKMGDSLLVKINI